MEHKKTNQNKSKWESVEMEPLGFVFQMIEFIKTARYVLIVNKANFRYISEQNMHNIIFDLPKHHYSDVKVVIQLTRLDVRG